MSNVRAVVYYVAGVLVGAAFAISLIEHVRPEHAPMLFYSGISLLVAHAVIDLSTATREEPADAAENR